MALKTIKRSISLSDKVNVWAEELAEIKGFDNFSAYLADLVRRDKEREDAERTGKAVPKAAGRHDPTEPAVFNDRTPEQKPKRVGSVPFGDSVMKP